MALINQNMSTNGVPKLVKFVAIFVALIILFFDAKPICGYQCRSSRS